MGKFFLLIKYLNICREILYRSTRKLRCFEKLNLIGVTTCSAEMQMQINVYILLSSKVQKVCF